MPKENSLKVVLESAGKIVLSNSEKQAVRMCTAADNMYAACKVGMELIHRVNKKEATVRDFADYRKILATCIAMVENEPEKPHRKIQVVETEVN
jgi:hypothetical protein